jgi:VanZ family protein
MGPATLRGWCAIGAIAAAALAAYVSLVPFRFAMPADATSLVDVLWRRAEVGVVSRGNGLANIVLFVPFGLCGLAALVDERTRLAAWAGSALLVLAASIGVSVGIEAAQAFVPGRTPSLTDIVAQTIGTGVGMGAWLVLAREARVWAARFSTGHASVIQLALGGYTAVLALYLLLPLDVTVDLGALAEKYRSGRVVLNPLASPTLTWSLVPAMIADLVMAAPVGVFASIAGLGPGERRPAFAAFALAATVFAAGELAQVFVMSRTADVVDLAIGLTGAAIGVGLTSRVLALTAGTADAPPAEAARPTLVMGLFGVTALYASYNLSPFDFNVSSAFIGDRIGRFAAMPFAGYYENAEFKALSDLTVKLAMSAPFGVLAQLLLGGRGRAPSRALATLFLGAAALFFAAVEFGQVLLPSRYPDNTDVLIAVFGTWAAMAFTRRFQARAAEGP